MVLDLLMLRRHQLLLVLSKQTLARSAKCDSATLIDVLEFLQQRPPEELRTYPIDQILQWAIENWNPETLRSP